MKVARHIVEARRKSIAALVSERGYLPIQVISRQFKISISTARRDIDELVNQKVLSRTHGGALSEYDRKFSPADQRRVVDADAKRAIGSAAAAMSTAGMTIYIDGGTTPLAVAEALAARKLSGLCVVTVNLGVARVFTDIPDVVVHIPSGMYLGHQEMVGGPEVAKSIQGWRFDLAFVGAEGLDRDGLHNSHSDIVAVAKALAKISARIVVCLAKSKVGKSAPERVAQTLSGFTLVTDASLEELAKAGVKLDGGTLVCT